MIRLSDVKVRLQYRWRVRQRLVVLHFARLDGPTAAWAAIWRERSNNSALACALTAGGSRATSYGARGKLIDCSTVSKVLRLGVCMSEPRAILSRASPSDVAPNHSEAQGARAAESPQSAT